MKKLWISALIFSLLLSCCLSSVPVSADSTIWYDSNYLYRNVYTVDSSLVDDALIDFPVLVYLNSSYLNWSLVNDDLSDLLFVSSSNVALSFEIDNYVVNDEAWLWVKLPSVSAVVDTKFFMYFGYPAASSSENPEDVWDSDFVMVQHMNDATTSTILDSTSNDNDGTKKAANEPIEATGKIGKGQDFDGTDDYIRTGNMDFTTEITVSACVKLVSIDGYRSILCKSWWTTNPKFWFLLDDVSNKWRFGIINVDGEDAIVDTIAPDTDWHFMCGTWKSGEAISLQVDDTVYTGNVRSGNISLSSIVAIGNMETGNGNIWDGIIDEVTISDVKRSSAWVGASYESQTLNLVSLIEVDDLSSFFEVASRGEIIGAAVVASLILIPLLIFILFAFFKRRR